MFSCSWTVAALGHLLQTTSEWNSRDVDMLNFILKVRDFSLQNLLLDSVNYCKITIEVCICKGFSLTYLESVMVNYRYIRQMFYRKRRKVNAFP